MFIESLLELGVVGLIIYAVAIFSFIKAAWKQKNKFAFAVVMCMFVLSLSTSIYTFKPYFNIMLYIILLLNTYNGNVERMHDGMPIPHYQYAQRNRPMRTQQ